jgi:aspartyl-tRNA(Asn)/glutamyl-tRNA(Gln) amidotransferase subunit B
VPLVEIVTKPSIKSATEAKLIVAEIRKVLRYIQASDANMERGQLRCDANISISDKGRETNNKVEIKNLNSLKNIEKSLKYEIKRQIEIWENGKNIINETRGFDEKNGTTYHIRNKGRKNYYRFIKDPDLHPLIIENHTIKEVFNSIGLLPKVYYKDFTENLKLNAEQIKILTNEKENALFFVNTIKLGVDKETTINMLVGPIIAKLKETNSKLEDTFLTPEKFAELIKLIDNECIDLTDAKENILPLLINYQNVSIQKIIKKHGLSQTNDSQELNNIISNILNKYPEKIEAYHNGKSGILGFFMGEIIKQSKSNFNKKKVKDLLKNMLDKWFVE